jgi:hypothetical protein
LTSTAWGRRCRLALGDFLKPDWGSYQLKGRKLIFNDITAFALYSNFSVKLSQWFYGVPQTEWKNWYNQYLVILMRELNEVSCLILNPQEAITLLNKCGQDGKGEKKITIRRPKSGGQIYIVEWHEFPLSRKINSLNI